MAEREHLRKTVRVIRLGARGLYRSQLPRMAAALAYRTIFSIIPVFVISLLVFGALVSDAQLESGITRILNATGLDTISIEPAELANPDSANPDSADPAAADPVSDDPESPPPDDAAPTEPEADPADTGAGDPPQEQTPPAEPDTRTAEETFRIDQIITELVDRVRGSVENIASAPIAIVSAFILIYAALSMLVELERSFNSICRAHAGRSWLRRIVLYWTILTLGSVMLAATFSVGDVFLDWTTSLVGGAPKIFASALGFVVTVGISTVLLLMVYLIVPNTRVRLRPAIGGALVAAVLWELGKWGFRQYLDSSAGYTNLYGSLALLPLFLLWVYATWLIVLFGLQVAYTTQNFDDLADDLEGADSGPTVVDPACILLVAAGVARRFAEGKSSFPNQIASQVGLPDALTARMLRRLVELGVVNEVEQGESRAYALARPAEAIDAAEVLRAAAALSMRREHADDPGFARLVAAREEALAGRTIADFAASRPADSSPSDGSS